MERYHIFKLGLAILFYAVYCIRPMMVNCLKLDDAVGSTNNETKNFIEEDFVYYQGVQGKPGVDFPVLSHIPRTSFDCKSLDSGYYADLETDCQVFHICEEGKKISFLCPNGTIFQQSELICEWWFKVNCTNSPSLYEESAEQLREENARRKASRKVQNHGAVMRMEESVSTSHSGRNFDNSRRGFEENGRKDNRFNNHASTYRNNHLDDRQSDDLSRASTSDIVRNGNNYKKPGPFSTSLPPQRKDGSANFQNQNSISRRRQDQIYDDYQYDDNQARISNQRNGNFRNQNTQGTNFDKSRKPAPFSKNNFQQHNQDFNQNFNDNQQQPVTESSHQRFGSRKTVSSSTSFQQSSFESGTDYQQQEGFNNNEQPVTEPNQRSSFGGSTSFNQPRGFNSNQQSTTESYQQHSFNDNTGFQHQESFNNNQQQPVTESNRRPSFRGSASFHGFQQQDKQQTFTETVGTSNRQSSFGGSTGSRQQTRNDNNQQQPPTDENQRHNDRESFRKNDQTTFFAGTTFQRGSFRGNTKFQQANNRNRHQSTTESNRNNNNQQFDLQNKKSVVDSTDFRNNNQNFQEKTHDSQNQNTERFNEEQPASKFDNNQYGNIDKSSSNDKSTDQQYINDNDFNNEERKSSPNNRNHKAEFDTTNQQPVLTDRSSTFQPFGTINEEFASNSKEEEVPFPSTINDGLSQPGTNRQDRKLIPTSTTFGTNDNRQDLAFNSQVNRPLPNGQFPYFQVPCEHFRFSPQYPSSFQQPTTTSKSEPQKPVPLGSNLDLLNQKEEPTTTIASTTVNTLSQTSTTQEERKPVGFPNLRQEAAFSTERNNQNRKTTSPQTTTKNSNKDGKASDTKQKSTVPLTRNDIVNRRLEPSDSEEAQITQETASFYKNSFNKIESNLKSTSPNPHPNHRETYSELKEPKYYSTKILSAISSVTPQYLTTQPINNGRPFVGSQVGTTLRKDQGITTTTNNYFSTTLPSTTTADQFTTTTKTDRTETTTVTTAIPTERTTLEPIFVSTSEPFTSSPQNTPVVPLHVDFNSSTNRPSTEISTKRIVDHATVYGKFAESGATTPAVQKLSISLSKTLSGSTFNKAAPRPLSVPSSQQVRISGSVQNKTSNKNSAEILSTSNSFNAGIPQVRFFGKVQSTTTKVPGVEIHFNSNSLGGGRKTPAGFSTTPKPKGKSLNFGSTSSNNFNSFSTTSKSSGKLSVSSTLPTNLNSFDTNRNDFVYFTSTTPQPFRKSSNFGSTLPVDLNTFSTTPNLNENFGISTTTGSVPTSTVYFSTTPQPLSFSTTPAEFDSFSTTSAGGTTTGFETTTYNPIGTTFDFTTTNAPRTSFSHRFSPQRFSTARTTSQSPSNGFYVTKNSDTTTKSFISDIIRPRPFELPPKAEVTGKPVYSTTPSSQPAPTFPTYKISSASPFTVPSTLKPTQPTPFSTAKPALPSTFENIDSMINALAEMANNHTVDSSRPGLVIPPSAGPQTLHTLAVYFANALDGIASDKEDHEDEEEEEDEDNLTQTELDKKKLTELLTRMTMDRYNELFNEDNEETTTVVSRSKSEEEDNDLEGQHSKNPTPPPKVRQLAKVFTQALSSYLDDPVTFKKVLEEVRPTEPPEESTDLGDDELLNFSDADVKSSFPPFFPTPPAARPTWGYLIAYNTSKTVDVKNSISSDGEHLQGADSQSFVSQLNKLNQNKETTTKSSIQLPEDHWTTSPGVTKLWKSAFNFDPASINENFGTTEATLTTTEVVTESPEPHHEIKYELRALSQLELNSTQVHGILIDFMNTTKVGDNRLQRILRKLNTTEEEFLAKMKAIEGNPLTRRLILLLISECGANATEEVRTEAVPIHTLLSRNLQKKEVLDTTIGVTNEGEKGTRKEKSPGDLKDIVDPSLDEDSEDARALQLLNSLYTIASRFGK